MFILVDKSKNTYVITAENAKRLEIILNKVKRHKNKRELYKEIKNFIEGGNEQ